MNLQDIDKVVATPELDVVRIVFLKDDNQVLLVKEADDPNWKLPGGKIHDGETIFKAVQREIKEELGVDAARVDILNYRSAKIPYSENIRHIFLFSPISEDKIVLNKDEVVEVRYFTIDNLPETKFKEHITSAVGIIE